MDDAPLVDSAALDRLREWGGDDLLARMIQLFLENSPDRMSQIEGGLEAGNWVEVERGAHSLKSSAGNVGAARVSRLALRMEEGAGGGGTDDLPGLHERLREVYRETRGELENVLRRETS